MALGWWSLGPKIIRTHHIRPDDTLQWIIVLGSLTLIFALIGAFMLFLGGLALVAVEQRGAFRDRTWAFGLFGGIIIIAAYAIDSWLSYWMSFRSFQFRNVVDDIASVGLFCVGCCLLCTAIYKRITSRTPQVNASVLASMLLLVAGSGMLFNLLPALTASQDEADNTRLERLAPPPSDPPLLFLGLDGATWRLLDRAIEDGNAPTLRDLASRGSTGTVEALWPPHWSGAAWAAILTGLPREINGVYEDLAAIAPGMPIMQVPLDPDPSLIPFYSVRTVMRAVGLVQVMPPPRALLRGKPVWQLLHDAGVDTAVVRFRFTYPPEGQAAVAVSDWAGRDQWENLGVRRNATRATVTPASRATELLAPFQSEAPSDPSLFGRLLPGPVPERPADALMDPIRELRIASDIDDRTFAVSESILKKNPRQSFLAVYIGGLDSAEHAFWPYRFPEDFPHDPPAQRDVERLGPVLDRYVRYIDERIARLLAHYATPPNILIVSDHGHGAATEIRGWRGWHTREGIFLTAGPSIAHRTERVSVSYYDILPTIAGLKGFRLNRRSGD
jgi:hypothetical protein